MAEIDEPENNEMMDGEGKMQEVRPVSGMYENWFLDYASYVILERAVPAINDGLKPVQRRILHSMKEMDDGRFNKVANVIGHTMQYHPHGDAAIGDAIVNMGQKDLLIETQGNWGDIRTGDSAAAPRYIEARLSKLANHIVFNPQTTEWQSSYDGRKKEPITLPVKFPLVLAQGVEGIAVGLATKIMPHNFVELCEASIKVLNGKKPKIYPDFPTGGMIDVSNYNDGLKGGKIRVRAKIEEVDKKTLSIKDVPYGTTTTSLIDSIIKANDQGKIKIKKVTDNTARDVDIEVQLGTGVSPSVMIDALYAFTDCESSISPNLCVIVDEKPHFIGVSEILKICTDQTVELLKRELEIKKRELQEKIFFSTLLKIFIKEGMYKNKLYEESNTFDKTVEVLNKLFAPYFDQFYREIVPEDYKRLVEKPLSSITRVDIKREDEKMAALQAEIDEVEHHLANLIPYAIAYFEELIKKFGQGKERKSEISSFDTIDVQQVVVNNTKLYMNPKEGFIGTGLKKDEFVCECSDIDDIIAFRKDGKMIVTKIADKTFVGKDIIHAQVWKKGDERMVYNLIYVDGGSGATMVKRFQVLGVTRDKEYDLTKGNKKSKVHYFSANPNGEAEIVTVSLTAGSSAKKKVFDYDFKELAIKGRGASGNRLTKYPVRKIELKTKGVSTLSGTDIWYDETVGRLNRDERGRYLGEFNGEDQIIVIYKDGNYELTSFELANRFDPKLIQDIGKHTPETMVSAIHVDGSSKTYYVKRFQVETTSPDKKFLFINEEPGSKLVVGTIQQNPVIELTTKKAKSKERLKEELSLVSLIDVKGWKATGNKLSSDNVVGVKLISKNDVIEKNIEKKEAGSEEKKEQKTADPTAKQKDELKKENKSFDVGSTIKLDVDKDDEGQMNLF